MLRSSLARAAAVFVPMLALCSAGMAQTESAPHLRLAQTKVTQLLVHRADAELGNDASYEGLQPVFFQVVIGTKGELVSAVPLRGQNVMLIPPAQEALKQWRWKPIQYQGKPAMIDTIVAVHYAANRQLGKAVPGWNPLGLWFVDWEIAQNLTIEKQPPLPEGGTPNGKVHLYGTISEKGELINVAVKDAPDEKEAAAAKAAATAWQWHPMMFDDKPVAVDTVVEVKFPKK